ncbi:serine/threonine protein kinase [Glaciihabitans tibetensis]|uniref:non-specific serine/threonine protein kinase n=1 Tax=Glaciihabitans tibetensis TaxID=1266600 RepID=A0A2T0VD44_9MICO|nr:serine/threonine-protein kinase [Glaciihabitans tibetensis]PRY68025.1 serine/threonine protein kinase [Glaciihabitans tibetensis]
MSDALQPLDAPLLLNRYRPRTLLARGGSALIYEGTDETLQRAVAIKVFRAGTDLVQYREELRVLAGLSHHGIVSIVDAGIDLSTPADPRPFLVMELVRGHTIQETLRQGSLPLRKVGEIGYEVAEALDYVHSQGVIHRDITPSNVMLTDYGTASARSRARLTDFGIAIGTDYIHAADAQVTGTAAYLSPEQVKNQSLTPATDIYSLGLVMLECLTNVVAFPGAAVRSALRRLNQDPLIPREVPREWRGLIAHMTEQDPAQRPSAAETASEIRALLRKRR